MRKPRDFDSELKVLADKAKVIKERRHASLASWQRQRVPRRSTPICWPVRCSMRSR